MQFIRNLTHYVLSRIYLRLWDKTRDYYLRQGLMCAALRHATRIK